MAEDVAGTAFLFAAARGHLPEILVVENGVPPPRGTRRGAVNDGIAGDRRRYRLKKLGLKASTR